MARTSPGDRGWARVIEHVLDDDARTRRAAWLLSALLLHLTIWLMGIVTAVVAVVVLELHGSVLVPVATGGFGAVSVVLAWLRKRALRERRPPPIAPSST